MKLVLWATLHLLTLLPSGILVIPARPSLHSMLVSKVRTLNAN